MHLEKLHIINYRNIAQADIIVSPGINCFVGVNGAGKTNMLDSIYYLSFCKSYTGVIDSLNILHEQQFMVLQGEYEIDGQSDTFYCGIKRGCKKQFKRNKTDYQRVSDHIGVLPLVIVAPADEALIYDSAEIRRKYMDSVISQSDKQYLDVLMRYNKLIINRNLLLKQMQTSLDEGRPIDMSLLDVHDQQLGRYGTFIAERRRSFVEWLTPCVCKTYEEMSQEVGRIGIVYKTGLDKYELYQGLVEARQRDLALGYTSRGIHKDDLEITFEGYPLRQVGSQGQRKSFVISLKLAQYRYLEYKRACSPILLLDDVFDKLDASRGENLIRIVSSQSFGQIFISDTNRERLAALLERLDKPYKIFDVKDGSVSELIG
ncbi:MAG: DNA replication and repair protein RecF [Marinilabiliaceae bacterium]|nr:DNA replication and repair protein RecF [Marinilabiliaceae bacterium]